ncbi:MAG: hypothetical protein NTY23_14870, partial [Chloroflexi bacterium]|nr:hypothetical protein [Chloroflexota bacterium]
VRQNWIDNLEVTVSLAYLPWPEYQNLLRTDPPQAWRSGWCMDHYDAYNFLYEDVVVNSVKFGSWSNATYESLLSLAALTADLPTRANLYKQAEEILVETDAVMLPIYHFGVGMATQPYLARGYGNGGAGGRIADWHYLYFVDLPLVMRNSP